MILPGESHGSYIVHSEKLAKIILDFLGRKEKRRQSRVDIGACLESLKNEF